MQNMGLENAAIEGDSGRAEARSAAVIRSTVKPSAKTAAEVLSGLAGPLESHIGDFGLSCVQPHFVHFHGL
jgi:hypothetical protein